MFRTEHAARQEAPSHFKSCGSVAQESDGKPLRFIVCSPTGRKGHDTVVQSVRFPVEWWSVDEAKEWLRGHGMKVSGFEAAVEDEMTTRRNSMTKAEKRIAWNQKFVAALKARGVSTMNLDWEGSVAHFFFSGLSPTEAANSYEGLTAKHETWRKNPSSPHQIQEWAVGIANHIAGESGYKIDAAEVDYWSERYTLRPGCENDFDEAKKTLMRILKSTWYERLVKQLHG